MFVCAQVHICAYREVKGQFQFGALSTFFFKIGTLTDLELTEQARLTDQ